MQILVNFEHYLNYQKRYNTTYLDKKNNYNLYSPSKNIRGVKINEIFDGIKTDYKVKKDVRGYYFITFSSNSGNKYRLDLIYDMGVYHIGFSLKDYTMGDDEYERLTELNESKEVFGKLAFILKEFSEKYNHKEFAIGGTGNPKKDRIYQYIMNYTSEWEKKDDDSYEMGWALYFRM